MPMIAMSVTIAKLSTLGLMSAMSNVMPSYSFGMRVLVRVHNSAVLPMIGETQVIDGLSIPF
jgi:hypothetical protein